MKEAWEVQLFLQRTAFKLETYWNWIFRSSLQTEFALSIQDTNSPHQYNCEIIMLNVMKSWDALNAGMHARAEQLGQIILPSH